MPLLRIDFFDVEEGQFTRNNFCWKKVVFVGKWSKRVNIYFFFDFSDFVGKYNFCWKIEPVLEII